MDIHLFSTETYKNRRNALAASFTGGQILLPGNRESSINFKDNWYPFRQDSSFLYYAGLNIPGLDLIIDIDQGKSILFGDELSIEDIIWTGPLPSLHELAEKVGIEEVLPAAKLRDYLSNEVHYLPPYRPEHILSLSSLLKIDPNKIESKASEPLINAIVAQRNIKTDEEIKSLHDACTLTSNMHLEVMTRARSGMFEYELVGIATAYGASNNVALSFQPICTVNGHILHNHSYQHQIQDNDLVLLDAGLYSDMQYAGDMTRTFPVNRRFSALHADLYQIVLNAHKSAARVIKPGITFLEVHLTACRSLANGLKDLGLMKGDINEAVQAGAHALFFPHGLGHMLGLDVHDMENLGETYVGYGQEMIKSKEFGLKSLRLARTLEEGFVLTVEPGLYFIPQLIEKFEAENKFADFIDYKEVRKVMYAGRGIRIEDDYLVTKDGIELLGEPLAKEIKEIENIREQAF